MTGPSITALVPVYNDRTLLGPTVRTVSDLLTNSVHGHEIIIVESGSTDGSAELADQLATERPHVRVVHEGARRGFGSAVRLGYTAAECDLIWLVPPDLPFPPETILRALPLIGRYVCVLSYRSRDPRPITRRIQSAAYNALLRAVLGVRARQVNSAFKLLDRRTVQALDLRSRGWFIDAEVAYHLDRMGVPYGEIPVELVDRPAGRSTVSLWTWLSVLREMYDFARSHPRPGAR